MGNFFSDLLRRRVPHILGVYLAAGWGMLEFTDWLVNRYYLSPHLIDLGLAAWALMIPTVLILAYFHGAPGRDRWTRVEKVGIPVNVLAAGGLLLASFAGKELGAVTQSVTLQNEAGESVEREIPKNEFRQSVAIFYFDNATGDSANDWLQVAFPFALHFDLSQDYFVDYRFGPHFAQRLREEGYEEGTELPLTLKRDVADQQHMEHFVAGRITAVDGEVAVDVSLYETRRGRLLAEHSFRGSNPLELADSISLQLKRDLDIPEQHIEGAEDLPVAELLTTDSSAFRTFSTGFRSAFVDNDWRGAVENWEAAVELDPGFAAAHLALWNGYTLLNETDRGARALETVMGQLYRLPERLQFVVKTNYYWLVEQDIEKALAAASMHTELFPQDASAHMQLATLYQVRNERERAIAAFSRALDLDPGQLDVLLVVGTLYRQGGELDSARGYYQRFAQAAPRDARGFRLTGEVYRLGGDHDAARQQYQRALVIDPDNVPTLIALAGLEADLGNFDAARAAYQEALDAATTPAQRAPVFAAQSTYRVHRGQPGAAIESMHERWAALEESQQPFVTLQEKLQDLGTYVVADRPQTALDSLRSIGERLSPPFDQLVPFGAATIHLELEEADSLEADLVGLEGLIQTFGLEGLRPFLLLAEGRVFEWRGECDQAILNYRRALEIGPENIGAYVHLGRCHRKLGDLSRAEEELQHYLSIRPARGEARYELALVYEAMGERERALQELREALEVWAEAEPQFEPARQARQKLRQLESGGP